MTFSFKVLISLNVKTTNVLEKKKKTYSQAFDGSGLIAVRCYDTMCVFACNLF